MLKVLTILGLSAGLPFAAQAQAQFVDDQFNEGTLGGHWTFVDGAPDAGSHTMTGTHLQLDAAEGSDFFYFVDDQAYVEQDAPTGTNWEVVTKIDNFAPVNGATQQPFNRAGIQLWQDNNHWISIGVLGNGDGTNVGIQAFWQTGPDNDRNRGTTDIDTVTTSPMYLKIVKSPKGYQGMMSADGTTWIDALPIVRNPDTADGYFTGEKIRLYQSSAPDEDVATVNEPADFDYVIANTGLTPPPSGFADDDFDGGSLGSTWQFYAGVMPGIMEVSGGTLKLTPGDGQDTWVGKERGMHVYQDAPDATDLILTMKGAPTTLIPNEQWNGYGIMLWQDQSHWVAIYNQRSETGTNRVEVGFKRADAFNGHVADFGVGSLPEYLRIVQTGGNYVVEYSFDNVTFTAVPNAAGYNYPTQMKNPQVRLFTKRVFVEGQVEYGDPVTAEFDWVESTIVTGADSWTLYK